MSSRETILQRLRNRSGGELTAPECDFSVLERPDWSTSERIALFEKAIESVHGEVHHCSNDNWLDRLAEVLSTRGVRNLLIPREHEIGLKLRSVAEREDLPNLLIYDEPIESWQPALFNDVDAGITSTRGGIAETGSLILWPTADEPRLMSLVPPVHVAVLYASELYTTFRDAMTAQNWAAGMPTNALLISGPSKTADIEQTLAYGVHGPKELIVLIIE
ncbi:lactate utilization protein [Marinobacter sp. M216]|uniref:Lactate utilization protein n=1 Tax=Marinobacter albus TaxID=3030833 RepID=A0ABT7HBC8_9GAMM|nr:MULTISPECIES: lactate utilization protein [unclassified Marinobacter]MBW7470910.1 lactate utilization protein [Marinobacter sp. F4218]MDK9556810.1 lactate utilization protein [Marinobacter sp. M216]